MLGRTSSTSSDLLERVLKIARSGDRAYKGADFPPFRVSRVPSRGAFRGFLKHALRACFKIPWGPVFAEKAGWRGATNEHIRQRSATEEQRSQSAYENPAGGGSFVCGLR